MHIIDKGMFNSGMFVYSRMPAHPHSCKQDMPHSHMYETILRIRFDVHVENLWLAKTEAKSDILKRRADSKLNENN